MFPKQKSAVTSYGNRLIIIVSLIGLLQLFLHQVVSPAAVDTKFYHIVQFAIDFLYAAVVIVCFSLLVSRYKHALQACESGSLSPINRQPDDVSVYDQEENLLVSNLNKQEVERYGKDELPTNDDLTQPADREYFCEFIEKFPVPIFIRMNNKWAYLNNSGAHMLGAHNKQEILDRPIFDFIHPDYHGLVAERRLQSEQEVEPVILKLRRVDGETIVVKSISIVSLYKEKEAEYMVVLDQTEIQRSKEMLQQAEKLSSVGELAAGIAHEIRNPLTSLKGFVQLFENIDVSRQDINAYCEIMLMEIDRINLIVSELLLLAKPREMDLKKQNLLTLIDQIVMLCNAQAILHDIEIVTCYDTNFMPIICEENKIKQVFINLIRNAIESMDNGGKITIQAKIADDMAVVDVIDQGCGISEDQLHKIGTPFFTTKEKGTGLGLMVSYRIIENHQGSISAQSKKNVGTTFTVQLPLVES